MLRENLLQSLIGIAYPIYDTLFKYKKTAWTTSMKELAEMEEKTLGHELSLFYETNGIQRMDRFENHDVCHVISGYLTNCIEESCMQFFLLATGKKSIFLYGTLFLSIIVLPEHIFKFMKAYKHGLKFNYFDHIDFENKLEIPLSSIQESLLKTEKEVPAVTSFRDKRKLCLLEFIE